MSEESAHGDGAATPTRARGGRGPHVRTLGLLLGVSAAIVAMALVPGAAGRDADDRAAQAVQRVPAKGTVPVAVWIETRHRGAPVAQRFLGLSFELSSLGQIASYGGSGDLVGLLRSLGPGILRFGGVSADTRVAWTDARTPRPAWASAVLDVAELRGLRRLAAASGWRVMLTIGLAHYDPRAAAREAAAAKAALGPWLAALELGNEPDAYPLHGFRREPWTFAGYAAQVASYRSAIQRTAPGIPLAGPDVSGSGAFQRWGRREALSERPALLTGHHYPLGCHDPSTPTIAGLLSATTRRLEGASLVRYMSVSRASAIGVRLDETGSVSCGGRAGVSNTFASALWAVGYIAHAMAIGVAGINFEGNPANCSGYSPLCAATPANLRAGFLRAQPEWYALLLAKALIGERPLRTTVTSPVGPKSPDGRTSLHGPNVAVTALLGGDGSLRFVIVDDDPPGTRPAAVNLHVGPAFGAASILSLTAPAPVAGAGVELGGRMVADDGSFAAPSGLPQLAAHGGVLSLTVAPSSAAVVTAAPARATGGH